MPTKDDEFRCLYTLPYTSNSGLFTLYPLPHSQISNYPLSIVHFPFSIVHYPLSIITGISVFFAMRAVTHH